VPDSGRRLQAEDAVIKMDNYGFAAVFARIRTNLLAQIEGLATSPNPKAALAAIEKELAALEAMATFGLKRRQRPP